MVFIPSFTDTCQYHSRLSGCSVPRVEPRYAVLSWRSDEAGTGVYVLPTIHVSLCACMCVESLVQNFASVTFSGLCFWLLLMTALKGETFVSELESLSLSACLHVQRSEIIVLICTPADIPVHWHSLCLQSRTAKCCTQDSVVQILAQLGRTSCGVERAIEPIRSS